MKYKSLFIVSILILLCPTHFVISKAVSNNKNNMYTINDAEYTDHEPLKFTSVSNFVQVKIEGSGYIYSTSYYFALIPMILIQFIFFGLEYIGINLNLPFIWDFFNNKLPEFFRDLSDYRDTFIPVFLSCPYMHINQQGGTYRIGDDTGRAFNGGIVGFTGVAWENND